MGSVVLTGSGLEEEAVPGPRGCARGATGEDALVARHTGEEGGLLLQLPLSGLVPTGRAVGSFLSAVDDCQGPA